MTAIPEHHAPVTPFDGAAVLLLIAMLILVGLMAGAVAKRFRLPSLTGQIIAGVLIGKMLPNMIPDATKAVFDPHITFAVSLVAVSVGGHLEFRRLRNAVRRILFICIAQVTATFALVLVAFQVFNPFGLSGNDVLPVSLVVAAIATSTSPVSTLHIIKEKRARGLLVKTTLAVVALNNLLTIVIFAICRGLAVDAMTGGPGDSSKSWLPSVGAVLLALAIGTVIGLIFVNFGKKLRHESDAESGGSHSRHRAAMLFTAMLVAISLAAGLCEYISNINMEGNLHPSPILACLALGLVMANCSSMKDEVLGLFEVLEAAIFSLFFVLAGAHFDMGAARLVLPAAATYIGVRIMGKVIGGYIGAVACGSISKISHHIGKALFAQGAIAIALVVIVEKDPLFAGVEHIVTACVLSGVVFFEVLAGPVLNRTLDRVKESDQDRNRLIEFLQEEFILPRVYAKDKWAVFEELAYFLIRAHKLDIPLETLITALREREEEIPTAIGRGIAVPHAKVEYGSEICGIMALLDPPIDFGAEDGEPVRLVVMMMTPHDQAHRHLEIIASVARIVQRDETRKALFEAQTAEQIHDIIYSEEHEGANYFLDD